HDASPPCDHRQLGQQAKGSTTKPRPHSSSSALEKASTQVESCQRTTLSPICLLVSLRALQFFSVIGTLILLPAARIHGALSIGATYPVSFVDIDGNKLSTADGHVTVIVLTTPADNLQGWSARLRSH